jgi:hypothetical protein
MGDMEPTAAVRIATVEAQKVGARQTYRQPRAISTTDIGRMERQARMDLADFMMANRLVPSADGVDVEWTCRVTGYCWPVPPELPVTMLAEFADQMRQQPVRATPIQWALPG